MLPWGRILPATLAFSVAFLTQGLSIVNDPVGIGGIGQAEEVASNDPETSEGIGGIGQAEEVASNDPVGIGGIGQAEEVPVGIGGIGHVGQHASSEVISCKCVRWKDAYKPDVGRARCGSGFEVYSLQMRFRYYNGKINHKWKMEYCQQFFERVEENFCVNYDIDPTSKAWCYVDPRCTEVPSVYIRKTSIAVKNCSKAAGDDLLALRDPNYINKISEKYKFPVDKITRYAYPQAYTLTPWGSKAWVKWEDVKDIWEHKWPVSDEMRGLINNYRVSHRRFVFYPGDATNYPNNTLVRAGGKDQIWITIPRKGRRNGFMYKCVRNCEY